MAAGNRSWSIWWIASPTATASRSQRRSTTEPRDHREVARKLSDKGCTRLDPSTASGASVAVGSMPFRPGPNGGAAAPRAHSTLHSTLFAISSIGTGRPNIDTRIMTEPVAAPQLKAIVGVPSQVNHGRYFKMCFPEAHPGIGGVRRCPVVEAGHIKAECGWLDEGNGDPNRPARLWVIRSSSRYWL